MYSVFSRFMTILLVLTLAACDTTQTTNTTNRTKGKNHSKSATTQYRNGQRLYPQSQDSAPRGPVPTHFEKVKPKYEPYSRYGNPDSYAVAGQTYRIMRSTKGFKQKGQASWYGTKFHSQRTSSGEKYNMYAMTAAHKTLPLPSYVKVKNLKNGREAIVKINDRGPFHSNRIIDLSYAAANKLGIFPNGTAPVEIEALNVGVGGKPHVAQYYVQAGAFGTKQLAQNLQVKLKKMTRVKVQVESYKQRYIVKVGPFVDKPSTNKLKTQLAQQGVRGAFTMVQ